MGRFTEKYIHYFSGLVTLLAVVIARVNPNDFDIKELLSSAINVSAITCGFLATAMSLLITLSNEEIIQRIKKFGLYELLVDYLKSGLGWSLWVAILSASGLLFNGNPSIMCYFVVIWLSTCVVCFVSVVRVMLILSKILDKMGK